MTTSNLTYFQRQEKLARQRLSYSLRYRMNQSWKQIADESAPDKVLALCTRYNHLKSRLQITTGKVEC